MPILKKYPKALKYSPLVIFGVLVLYLLTFFYYQENRRCVWAMDPKIWARPILGGWPRPLPQPTLDEKIFCAPKYFAVQSGFCEDHGVGPFCEWRPLQ